MLKNLFYESLFTIQYTLRNKIENILLANTFDKKFAKNFY